MLSDEETLEIMHLGNVARQQMAEEQAARNTPVLAQVKAMVTPEVFAQIMEELEEFGEVYDYAIVEQPAGQPQDNGFSLGDVYVDQSCGLAGDDFSGTVAIPLPGGRYFQFGFCC